MKAVIPVAGVGSKLRPHTHTQPKPLIPVAGKPILGHIIDGLIEADITQIVFVVGYLKEKIQEYVLGEFEDKVECEFVVQTPRKGLAHAIWVAVELFRTEEEILIVLGDTIFGNDVEDILRIPSSSLGVQEVVDPRTFGVAVVDTHMQVHKVVEKPQIPTSNLALVGLYKIQEVPLFVQMLSEMMEEELPANHLHSLTDALMRMIDRGAYFHAYRVENWYDCGRKQSLLQANQTLLERIEEFPVYNYDNSVIIPPVHIAEGCTIKNSIIGPYVAIAEKSTIKNSIVRNSILGAYSHLESIILNTSVVGNDASLKGKSNSVSIGDSTQIDFDE